MKLIFLGSGSAFTIGADNFHSNILLVSDRGRTLLIDCGTDIRFSLYRAGFSHQDITDIYVSHLHGDHTGGLEYIGFSTKFDPDCQKPRLYISADMAEDLWNKSLSGAMGSIQGERVGIDSFYEVKSIDRGGHFCWENVVFQLIKVRHVNNGSFDVPSYGLFFELEGSKIFLSTDSLLCLENNRDYYEQADLIFHDCETMSVQTHIHAHYTDLLTLPEAIRCKMWLYHYQPGRLPDAGKHGFQGFVKRGQQFEFLSGSVKTGELEMDLQS